MSLLHVESFGDIHIRRRESQARFTNECFEVRCVHFHDICPFIEPVGGERHGGEACAEYLFNLIALRLEASTREKYIEIFEIQHLLERCLEPADNLKVGCLSHADSVQVGFQRKVRPSENHVRRVVQQTYDTLNRKLVDLWHRLKLPSHFLDCPFLIDSIFSEAALEELPAYSWSPQPNATLTR